MASQSPPKAVFSPVRARAVWLTVGVMFIIAFCTLAGIAFRETARADAERVESLRGLLEAGVSTSGVRDWLIDAPSGGPSTTLAFSAAVLAVIALMVLLWALSRALVRQAELERALRRVRRERTLAARMSTYLAEETAAGVAVVESGGYIRKSNRVYESLPDALKSRLKALLTNPPVTPLAESGESQSGIQSCEERTLIWTFPSGDGQRLRIRRWFLDSGRRYALVLIGDRSLSVLADRPVESPTQIDANDALAEALRLLAPHIRNAKADIRSHVLPTVFARRGEIVDVLRQVVDVILASTKTEPRIDISAEVKENKATFSITAYDRQTLALPDVIGGRELQQEQSADGGVIVKFLVPIPPAPSPDLPASGPA